MKRFFTILIIVLAAAALLLAVYRWFAEDVPAMVEMLEAGSELTNAPKPSPPQPRLVLPKAEPVPTDATTAHTAEEKAAEAAEAKVERFDELTDKWMEPAANGVEMSDVDAFAAAFREVPPDRRDECIHRALNLIPDENVMLLMGVLMDKSQDRDIVETVFNDILNRDEDVKKPILREIFKDRTHPCWTDVAWIFEVTGEMEK